jgi:hypothetical protein
MLSHLSGRLLVCFHECKSHEMVARSGCVSSQAIVVQR